MYFGRIVELAPAEEIFARRATIHELIARSAPACRPRAAPEGEDAELPDPLKPRRAAPSPALPPRRPRSAHHETRVRGPWPRTLGRMSHPAR